MKINYENTAPIESIEIEQEEKGSIAEKSIVVRCGRDTQQDYIDINFEKKIDGLKHGNKLFRLSWLKSIELRDALTLFIEQQR